MAQLFVSGMAHFFVVVSGSKIHERVAHFFIDIYKLQDPVCPTPVGKRERERWTANLDWFGYLSIRQGTHYQRRWIGGLFHDKILPG